MNAKKLTAMLMSAIFVWQCIPATALAPDTSPEPVVMEEPIPAVELTMDEGLTPEIIVEEPASEVEPAPEEEIPTEIMVEEPVYAASLVSGDFEYVVNDDGTATITGFVGEESGDLIIHGEIDGYTVTKIGDGAFSFCEGFYGYLIIPENVTYIGNGAFWNCYNLSGNLIIPTSVMYIGAHAFRRCDGFIGSLIIPDSVVTIGDHAFDGCSGLNGRLYISKK